MSEYWKSTPKYWCKHCRTHVRDTPFAKREHEASPRHQGSIQRSLRTLHRDHERGERDKQRAKDEVARLNGIVSGAGDVSGGAPQSGKRAVPLPPPRQQQQQQPPRQATQEERKRQMVQLAEMGVAVPEAYRGDMALAGEWTSTGVERVVGPSTMRGKFKQEDGEADSKDEATSFGTRKRRNEDEDEDVEAEAARNGETAVRRGWGQTFKSYRTGDEEAAVDMEALMNGPVVKSEPTKVEKGEVPPEVKKEESAGDDSGLAPAEPAKIDTAVELETLEAAPVFKKRKKVAVRAG